MPNYIYKRCLLLFGFRNVESLDNNILQTLLNSTDNLEARQDNQIGKINVK